MQDFFLKKRIYFHDTDAGGVVYYANYLKFLEEARHEFCLQHGIDLIEYARQGILFPVVRVEVDYKSPARYGDVITILTKLERLRNASLHFFQEIQKEKKILLQAKVVVACIDKDFSAIAIPAQLRDLFSRINLNGV